MKDIQDDFVYNALMNNDLGMLKSLMATNLKIENPEKFI